MSLAMKKCEPCDSGTKKLTPAEAHAMLKEIPGWELTTDASAISRYFEFKNFKDALAFVNTIGGIAEAEKHHPDVGLGWGYVDVTVMTHTIDGLHNNDFILAAKINEAFQSR